MSRKKFWAYLKNEQGQPIPSASITFKLDDTGSLATIYSTSVSAANDEIDQSTLTTDVSGFFEFYIGDVYEQGTNRVGYDPDQQFRLEWSSPDGSRSGYIDDMLMFYQVFPVDETDSVSTTKNKLASNELSWGWSTHRQQTWFHEIHQITQVDRSDSVDSTYSHLVSNKFMNDLKSELEALQASGGESITIESSAAVVRSTDIATVSWTDDTSASGLYYYDFNHSFNTRYPLIQLWCTDLKCMQIPAKVVFTDVNTTRIYVPANQIVGKHIIGISESNATIQQENPEIPLSLQTLNVSSSSLTPYIEFDATPSAALQTLSMTSYSTSVSATSGATPPVSGWTDDYFASGLGSQWSTSLGTGASITTPLSGSIRLTSGDGTISDTTFNPSGIYQRLGDYSNSSDIKIEILNYSAIPANGRISFGMYWNSDNWLFIHQRLTDGSSSIWYSSRVDGVGAENLDFNENPTPVMWLRCLHIISTGFAAIRYSDVENPTASDWTQIIGYAAPWPTQTPDIWISVTDDSTGGLFYADIDSAIGTIS